MRNLGLNPYLPSWEYIPDGEPYVFDGRVYVYGSHDRFNGHMYCLNDYVCWSAPLSDLGNWRYEGVIYRKTDDPANRDGSACLFAPDVTVGPDKRYYLYYSLNSLPVVSVAVSDHPTGPYDFYGYVSYPDGTRLGEGIGDEPQFDPSVLTEGNTVYLYTGFCLPDDKDRSGAMVTVLEPDMLTVRTKPSFVLPNKPYSAGSGFEGFEFFEAPSIRKRGDLYYLIYSSVQMYELCYATSKEPTAGFTYGGVIISNNDLGIQTYKPADMPTYYGGNNHGSIIELNGDWFIFYHRHTNGTNYSRQVCAERITINADNSISQVSMSSCGLNGGPLPGEGTYQTYIACNLFCSKPNPYTGGMGGNGLWMDAFYPKITQDGGDGDREDAYILNMTDSATAGFKYFACQGVRQIMIRTRGYARGHFELRTQIGGESIGSIAINYSNFWHDYQADIHIPDGTHALYFTYRGEGSVAFASFTLIR